MARAQDRLNARVARALAGTLAVLVALEYFFAPHYNPVFPWHHVTGYMAGIGLCACILFVLLARFAGKPLLQRPERADGRDGDGNGHGKGGESDGRGADD